MMNTPELGCGRSPRGGACCSRRWLSLATPGQCVEVGPLDDGSGRVAVRHSHHPDGDVIVYTQGEWEAFTRGVIDGDFNFS